MWGCRNKIGRPQPRSISSIRAPLMIIVDLGACAVAFMQAPPILSWPHHAVFVVLSVSAGHQIGNQPSGLLSLLDITCKASIAKEQARRSRSRSLAACHL